MTPMQASQYVKRAAYEVGFDRCGIARAEPIGRASYLRRWLDAGRAGSMTYLHRRFDERTNPAVYLEGARSVIVVALSYHQPTADSSLEGVGPSKEKQEPASCDKGPPLGRIARYAWGEDYHRVVKEKLESLRQRMESNLPGPFSSRLCVDTGPVLEREWAARAGVGWIGKNTMVLHEHLGSYFFLGEIVTTLALEPDEPALGHCGTCTACLDACPTQAFPAPYEMDASRCISYLTIEHRGDIEPALSRSMGSWVFGCDVCQEVCPFNRQAPPTREPRFAVLPPAPAVSLGELLDWSEEDYRQRLRHRAIKRAKWEMLRRNARIAMANARVPSESPYGEDRPSASAMT